MNQKKQKRIVELTERIEDTDNGEHDDDDEDMTVEDYLRQEF